MKRAENHIMSQTVDVNWEPLKWPIAPDGYIPNSVIRSWSRRGKGLTDRWDNVILYSLHQECTPNDQEDVSSRIIWVIQDGEEEEENIDDVKRRKREKEDEKNKKEEDNTQMTEKEDKKKEQEVEKVLKENKKKEEKETSNKKKGDKVNITDLLKQSHDIQKKTNLQNQLKTFDDGKMKPQREEVSSTKAVHFLPTSSHENGPKLLSDLREDMKLHETITAPLQYLSVQNTQRLSSVIPKGWPEPPVESPVVSADTADTPKQEPRFTIYPQPEESQNWTTHPQKSAPLKPEDPQHQPYLGPTECSPIRNKRSLLSLDKYNNIRDQAQVPLDLKVLKLYKKFKAGNKNLSHHGKLSTTAERLPVSRATHSTIQTISGGVSLNSGLSSSAASATIQTQPHRIIHTPIKDQRAHKPTPEWRKSLYKLISLQGFRSPQAAKLATVDPPVKPSKARQHAVSISSIRAGQVAAHQRVVQKIQMKDTVEMASSHFHHVIPVASQHSFFTLDTSGKTQYGRLQFDWMRRHEEDKLLSICSLD